MQILVVVANIQMGTLKTEVEKGSMRTAVGHGLVDPKRQVNSVKACIYCIVSRKGIRLIFRNQDMEFSGNANELGDVSKSPGKSYLFFLTVKQSLESVYPEKGFADWQSTLLLMCPVRF